MAGIDPSASGGSTSTGGTGNFGGSGPTAANFSNAYQYNTSTTNDNSNITASAQTAYAPTISTGSGSTFTYSGSDYGALSAAATEVGQVLGFAQDVSRNSLGLAKSVSDQGAATIREQGAGALALITKPFIYAAVLAVLLILGALYFFFGKKKRDS